MEFRRLLPLNRGQSLAIAPTGPFCVYCPTANSIYSKGMAHRINIRKNGTRKAPKKNSINNLK